MAIGIGVYMETKPLDRVDIGVVRTRGFVTLTFVHTDGTSVIIILTKEKIPGFIDALKRKFDTLNH